MNSFHVLDEMCKAVYASLISSFLTRINFNTGNWPVKKTNSMEEMFLEKKTEVQYTAHHFLSFNLKLKLNNTSI